ncbi:chromosomal replication initiator protein DnaA [Thermovibrio guaymasensis]|uniref:Chromosomal replication initiator protein DnaA n=1 Tax=Thermovibrio guaymasensis TaxID=240167 RepID=A0A420W5N3_9BACT|nr:chromosomal replication initiator protein DnaA [Thermovibrio guaymasensis]RKQ60410.1 chromosomal replication initiator protein DnaA [Thermovibrio guaymasensis]
MDKNWEALVKGLKKRVKPTTYKVVFKSLKLVSVDEEKITLQVKDRTVKDLILKLHLKTLEEIVKEVFGKELKVEIVSREETEKPKQLELGLFESRGREEEIQSNLNPKYTFDNFIVGASNQFAHAAARAVAENPGKAYNPLFIYGGVGLGKTHLMQAIGNYIKSKDPRKRILYTTTETFMNQLIEALKGDRISSFREKYRNIDVLLIDDIQFIGGKERTQIEFFHTFNALYDAGKQVVLTSDRPPKDIPTLTERLRSRFEWGLIADIQPPDFETRVAILKRKAEVENIEVSDKVIKLLATIIKSNIRQLEGALIKLKAKATLEGRPITEKLVRELFSEEKPEEKRKEKIREISIKIIKETVSSELGVEVELLDSPTRKKRVAFARQVAMYLAKKIGGYPYTQIAVSFNRDDHTTVMHAVRKIEEMIEEDEKVSSLLEKLELKVREAVERSSKVIHTGVDNYVDNHVDN